MVDKRPLRPRRGEVRSMFRSKSYDTLFHILVAASAQPFDREGRIARLKFGVVQKRPTTISSPNDDSRYI